MCHSRSQATSARARATFIAAWIVVALIGYFAPLEWSSALAQSSPSPVPCLANFTSPLLVPVSGRLGDIRVDDRCEHVYVTNTSSNRVEVFSISRGSLQAPIAVGAAPVGLDTSPDGATLYVANSGGNNISVVDVVGGVEKSKIPVQPSSSNDTPFSLAVASNGLVFFSTTFAGSGFGGRLLQLDPSSGVVSPRTDFFIRGMTTEVTFLDASADRSAIGVVAGDISSGPVFKYVAAANSFTPERDLNAFIAYVAVGNSGKSVLVDPGTYVLDSNLNQSGMIPGGNFGVAIDADGVTGYRAGPSGIDVLNLSTFLMTDTLSVGDTISGNSFGFGPGIGRMAISRDGSLLAVITDSGFSLVQAKRAAVVPFAKISARTGIKLKDQTSGTRFSVEGELVLGSESNGIDPLKENVAVQFGSLTLSITAGSFRQSKDPFKKDSFTFNGTLDGIAIEAVLRRFANGAYYFAVYGNGGDLSGTTLPVNVGLIIGDDRGTTKLTAGQAYFRSER